MSNDVAQRQEDRALTLQTAETTLVGGAVMAKNGKELVGGLNWLAERYSDEGEPANQRPYLQSYLRILELLLARSDFLKLDPLIELQTFLAQIDNGETVEILTPRKRTGRPPVSMEKLAWWATASALITGLMARYGYTEEPAAKAVAGEFRKRGIPLPGNKGCAKPRLETTSKLARRSSAGQKGRLCASSV
jgi:hypothetical protein